MQKVNRKWPVVLTAAIREAFRSMRNAVTTSTTVIALHSLINVRTSGNLLIMQKNIRGKRATAPIVEFLLN